MDVPLGSRVRGLRRITRSPINLKFIKMPPRRASTAAMVCFMRGVAAAALALLTSGCNSLESAPPVASEAAGFETVAALSGPLTRAYTISPGDDLLIDSFYHSELKQPVTVQSDGRISLMLVGTVTAAGKTPQQLSQELTRQYRRFLDNADVNVSLSGSAALSVYVGGEVAKPTVLPMKGGLSLLQSITEAGGFRATANKEQVLILRPVKNGHFQTFQVNAEEILGNGASEIYLEPRDVVYVPQSAIAQVDQFVDQYINQIVPRSFNGNFGFQYNYGLGNAATSASTTTPRTTP